MRVTANPFLSRVAVFGKDDRTPLPERLKSLEGSVGLLYDQSSRTVCSAFCVGDDIVATAGHCLYGTDHEHTPKLAELHLPLAREESRTSRRPSPEHAPKASASM